MANSILTVSGSPGFGPYTATFTLGKLRDEYVQVRVNEEVDGLDAPLYRDIEWLSDTLFNITSGDEPDGDDEVHIIRTIPDDVLIHDYSNGAVINEENLDESNLQTIMLVHQFLDGRITEPLQNDLDMGDHKIVNLADGTDPEDAVNLSQITPLIDGLADLADAVDAAEAAQAAAELAQAGAEAAEANAAADAVATAADRVQTGLDSVATAADAVSTAADVALTAADRIQTGADRVATAADVISAGAAQTAAEAARDVAKAAAGFTYTYSTDTSASDPTSGKLKFNNTTLSSATALYISETTGLSQAIAAEIATWDDSTSTVRGKLRIFKQSDPSIFVLFNMTGAVTDNGTWDTVNVTYVAGATSLTNNDVVTIQPIRNGDKGDAGGSLAAFTESLNTASPNNTVNASALTASGGTTNQDAVLVPKGTGAVQAQIADSGTGGGNKRGQNAVDWQTVRSAATQVASGTGAFIPGGRNNTASGTDSEASGNGSNASANLAIAKGSSNSASGAGATVIGAAGTGNGSYAVCLMYSGVAGAQAFSGGYETTATGAYATAWGYRATTRGIQGYHVWASHIHAASGDNQSGDISLGARTTGTTSTRLTSDATAASTANQLVLQNNSRMIVTGHIGGKKSGSADGDSWTFKASLYRGANAASTVMEEYTVESAKSTVLFGTPVLSADTTNGSFAINVVGLSATNIQWQATCRVTEIVYA